MAYASGDGGGRKPSDDSSGNGSLIGGASDFAKGKAIEKLNSFKPEFLSTDSDGSRFKPDGNVSDGASGQGRAAKLGNDIKEGAQAAKNVAKTAEQTFGNNKQLPGGGVGGALKKVEGHSSKPKEPENQNIAKAEAAGKTATRAAGAAVAVGAALVGKEDTAAKIAKNLIQQIAANPIKFLKETKTGVLVILGLAILSFGTIVMMFSFIGVFTIQHVSETAKDTALKLTTVDESFEAGKAIFSAGKKGFDAVFGTTQLAPINFATSTSDSSSQSEPDVQLAQSETSTETTEITKLLDELDISEVLKKLGETDTLRIDRNGEKVKFEDIETINRETDKLDIAGRIIDLNRDPRDPAFMNELSIAIRASNLFSHASRTMLSDPVKKIYSDAGINLERWEGSAEKITDYGKNIKSSYDSVSQGIQKVGTSLEDIDQAGEKTDDVASELLNSNPSSAKKNYVRKTVNGAWAGIADVDNSDSNAVSSFTAKYQNSPGLFAVASYCSARSYIEAYDTIAKQQYIGAQRNGVKILSSADQVKVGNTGRQAVGGEAQRHESYEQSRAYQKAIGSDVRNKTPDLNESQLAYQDPRIVRAAMQSVVNLLEQPFSDEGLLDGIASLIDPGGGLLSQIAGFVTDRISNFVSIATVGVDTIRGALGKDNLQSVIAQQAGKLLCKGMSNDAAQVAIQIADRVSRALPGASAGEVGSALVLQNVRDSLINNGAPVFAKQLGLEGSVFDKPSAEMIYFMFNSHKGLDYSGLDDGVDLISKEFEGAVAFGNDVSRAGGGRPLTPTECAVARGVTNEQNAIIQRSKPIFARLFSPNETYSPVSLALAHTPLSTNGAVSKTRVALMNTVNPVNTVVATTQKLAYSTTLVDKPTFALSDNAEDQQLCYGYSVAEREKLASDPSFWPVQNSIVVEANLDDLQQRFGDCYSKQMYELIIADANDSDSVSAYGGKCNSSSLSNDDALRYRTYLGSKMQLESLVSMQTISEDARTNPITPGSAPEGEITEAQTVVIQNCGGDARTFQGIAEQVEALCTSAKNANVHLTINNSWRPTSEQIRLRRQNCGTSQYQIYEAPASSCSPPTAKPGASNHQRGVAVDFDNCDTRSSACYQWLAANAGQFGLKNLPGEPWHWSIDGA